MKHKGVLSGNEEGSVLVYSLVVLLLLTLLGLMGSKTAVYELNISGNDRAIHEMKISAESAAVTAAQLFEVQSDAVCRDRDWGSNTRLPWYSRGADDQFDNINNFLVKNDEITTYTQDIGNWDSNNSAVLLDQLTGLAPAQLQNSRYQVIDMGVADGDSQGTGNNITNLHNLLISGSNQRGQRKSIIQIGYRKRY